MATGNCSRTRSRLPSNALTFILLVLLALGLVPFRPPNTAKSSSLPRDTTGRLVVDGRTRTYDVHLLPATMAGAPSHSHSPCRGGRNERRNGATHPLQRRRRSAEVHRRLPKRSPVEVDGWSRDPSPRARGHQRRGIHLNPHRETWDRPPRRPASHLRDWHFKWRVHVAPPRV